MQHKSAITGTVVRTKNFQSIGVGIGGVAVATLLECVIGAECPVGIKSVLDSDGGVHRIRRVIVRIDQRARCATSYNIGVVDGLQCIDPPVLCEIVIVQAEPAADHGVAGVSECVGQADTRREGLAEIVRCAGDVRIDAPLQRS